MNPFVSSSDFFAIRARNAPWGIDFRIVSTLFRNAVYSVPVNIRLRLSERRRRSAISPLVVVEDDVRSRFWWPAWVSLRVPAVREGASDEGDAVRILSRSRRPPFRGPPRSTAECRPDSVAGLSRSGNPEIPPKVRSVGKSSRLPVRILWA